MLIAEYSYETDIKVKQQEAREDGFEQGQQMLLIQIVCRKLAKGKTPEEIAEFLEEDLPKIQSICDVAAGFAPDYDSRLIYDKMNNPYDF